MLLSQQLKTKKAISKAKKAIKQGNTALALELYNSVLQHQPNHPIARKGLSKLQKELSRNQSIQTQTVNPPQHQINALINLYQSRQVAETEQACRELLQIYPYSFIVLNLFGSSLSGQGKFEEAIRSYDKAIQIKPDFAEAYYNRGIALQELGKLQEAIGSYDKATQIKPDYAEAYYNRGITLQELGKLQEAIGSYDKATQIKPDYAEAYYNRGIALQELEMLKEEIKSYDKAIQIKPDFAEAYYNRGIALQELGKLQEAIGSCQKAISINPQNDSFWAGFADILRKVRLTSYSGDLCYYLFKALEQPTVRPKNVSGTVASVLHYHPVVKGILELSKSNHIDEDIDHLTEQISTVPLLLRVMELSPIADLDLEKMLTMMRKAMLNKALNRDGEAQGLPFYAALAMHCFVNEYVFTESEEEKQEIELLQEAVKVILAKEGTVSATRIAVLGAYRPLYCFSWAEDLQKREWSDEVKKVIVGQINNVREEQALRSKIPRLTSIEDKVSQLVRNQYEENPYPRWVNAGLYDKPMRTGQVLRSIRLNMNFDAQHFSNKPDILVAGCGTGEHALATASRFLNCNVLAVDLSLSSLSYGMRKTQELGITNIIYMQGDILKLDQLEREFDIIESVGVLHHMDDPLAGWKVLVDRLRTGGVMLIALYSEIARQSIVEARKQIAKKEYTSSPDDIRQYREEIINMDINTDSESSKIIGSRDFYSLSEFRDLLFHVQEHRFTLPQIEEALSNLGLNFLGFEHKQSWVRSKFIERYPETDALTSLPLWHQFELENPDIFSGMYRFWVQKK